MSQQKDFFRKLLPSTLHFSWQDMFQPIKQLLRVAPAAVFIFTSACTALDPAPPALVGTANPLDTPWCSTPSTP